LLLRPLRFPEPDRIVAETYKGNSEEKHVT
jgi:hypothetical protein